MTADDERAGLLFDYAVAHVKFTNEDVMRAHDWTIKMFNRAARRLRLTFADDSINLVCHPRGQGQDWEYELVGDYAKARGWIANRILDTESRIETERAVMSSIANNIDGRTVQGRKVRLISSVLGGLQEQLAALNEQGRLWGDWTWRDDEDDEDDKDDGQGPH
jgi:hypothetical protein